METRPDRRGARPSDQAGGAHVGRVNSYARIRYCAAIGADSVDGTQWVRWRNRHQNNGLAAVSQGAQLLLPSTVHPRSSPDARPHPRQRRL